jgi:hypothetical protein
MDQPTEPISPRDPSQPARRQLIRQAERRCLPQGAMRAIPVVLVEDSASTDRSCRQPKTSSSRPTLVRCANLIVAYELPIVIGWQQRSGSGPSHHRAHTRGEARSCADAGAFRLAGGLCAPQPRELGVIPSAQPATVLAGDRSAPGWSVDRAGVVDPTECAAGAVVVVVAAPSPGPRAPLPLAPPRPAPGWPDRSGPGLSAVHRCPAPPRSWARSHPAASAAAGYSRFAMARTARGHPAMAGRCAASR